MKLIIQIPCLNEAGQLPETLKRLPTQVEGFDAVEWLVIDDGSTDDTTDVARANGVHHLVRLPVHKGLALAFQAGLDACLKLGADVIVNTDADGQYDGADIPRLVKPILSGEADLVVGDRGVAAVEEFSWVKRRLQSVGSWVVTKASGTAVPDATSGFRAYNRDAALQLVVVNTFTYTLESLIQAGNSAVTLSYVPVARQTVGRPSRLFQSNWDYIRRSVGVITRVYAFYRPLRLFATVAVVLGAAGVAAWSPFLVSWAHGRPGGHLQSIILGAVLMIAAIQVLGLGIVADLLGRQRVLSQRTLERVRRLELHVGVAPSHYQPGRARPPVGPGAQDGLSGTSRPDSPGV
ncbi:MAG TPA: glycosyltransferase family 2 protein [Acidimicrobiales bacterium]|nr:glycosyltransferase family 2 protein [Acidimicrobiales bacterium]